MTTETHFELLRKRPKKCTNARRKSTKTHRFKNRRQTNPAL